MKSRIKLAEQIILSYGIDKEEIDKINQIASKFNVKHKTVSKENLNEKIGFLCEFKSFEKSDEVNANECNEKCLVFSGILQKNISSLLKELKINGINIPLKAMVTPSNQSWSLFDLIEELKKEHKFMTERK